MTKYCKYCDSKLFGDWLDSRDGAFCNKEHGLIWKQKKRIAELEEENEFLKSELQIAEIKYEIGRNMP